MAKTKRSHTSVSRITRTYMLTLTAVVFVLTVAILFLVGWSLYQNSKADAENLVTSLRSTFIDDRPDWNRWRDTSSINTKDSFVKITVHDATHNEVIYSSGTKTLLSHPRFRLPIFDGIEVFQDHQLFYHVQNTQKRIHYEIWISLHELTKLFKDIVISAFVIMILGIFIGGGLVWLTARSLNKPLIALTRAIQKITQSENMTYHETLPTYDDPSEVRDLSVAFNKLLTSLNRQVLRDHQFVSDASHELRTPIAGIRGNVQLIQRHGKDHPEVIPQSIEFIDRESKRMQKLVESLLELSRSDHLELKLTDVNLSQLTHELLEDYQFQLKQKLDSQIDAGVFAYCDYATVQQMMLALLDNAKKYTPADGTISVSVKKVSKFAEIRISDTGMGIPDDQKSKIFDRFYRVDQARSQKIPGTGLGLAIVAQLVKLNHGTIHVANNQPKGTSFILRLPSQK